MLSRGKKGKQILDLVIDACSAMQNLREAILIYRDRMSMEGNERKRSDLLRVCLVGRKLGYWTTLANYRSFLHIVRLETEQIYGL